LRALANDLDPSVRATVLTGLERAGALTDTEVSTALGDPSSAVRRRAASLAACHPTVDLLGALADADSSVAESAAWALGEQGAVSVEVITALAQMATRHDDVLCREAAVAALGALGHEAGLDAILAATTDKPAIRRRAVLALAPFEGPEVDAALERALTDHDWQVRQAAEDLLS
jgi:HEAT repeat protein